MKAWMGRGLLVACAAMTATAFAVELETEEQKLGYIIGSDVGASLRQQGTEVDLEALFEALRNAYEGGASAMTTEEIQRVREAYLTKRQAAAAADQQTQAGENRLEGEQFLASNSQAEGVVLTDSGLQYKVLEMGDGPMPTATDTVRVHYRGTLLNGTEFDSSYARNEPISFALNRVIAGWTEGVQLMPIGSKFMFYIKPELAYGEGGGGPIPPNATLIFEVELLGIENAAE